MATRDAGDGAAPRRRGPRSDGQRNRRLVLEAAARAFATDGPDASLNAVAQDAGVGIATLYRHFPTREALVEATYRDSLEALYAAAGVLLAEHDALTALGAWTAAFLDFVGLKYAVADALRALADAPPLSRTDILDRLTGTVETLLDAGRRAGAVRADVRAEDVVATLTGIALVAGRPNRRDQADRLVDLLLAGLTAAAPPHLRAG